MFIESVRALSLDHRVVVTLPADGPLVPVLREIGAEVRILSVPVLRKAYMSPTGMIKLAFSALRAMPSALRLLRGASAVYVNTITIPIWLAAARIARVPSVVHVHEAEDRVRGPVHTALTAPLRLARAIIANSRASAAALGPVGERGQVVYNGVAAPDDITEPRSVLTPPARIVLVGRLSQVKGSDIAVKAAGLLRERGYDATLTLVGAVYPGNEPFEEELRRLANGERVEFAGFRSSVGASLSAADLAIVPSRMESLGNVAVEAMLAGRPVVAAAVQGLNEVVTDGENGVLVAPDDPAALADGVARLLDDWDGALAMAKRAQADAAERFGRDRYHGELREAVRRLIHPPAPDNDNAPAARTQSTR
ncbi:glycosyltransferase family 4 protein [Actinomadura barringtoniae]|nr:glycosyltransferase family 4 protein [Actinomadura barringtoniae]